MALPLASPSLARPGLSLTHPTPPHPLGLSSYHHIIPSSLETPHAEPSFLYPPFSFPLPLTTLPLYLCPTTSTPTAENRPLQRVDPPRPHPRRRQSLAPRPSPWPLFHCHRPHLRPRRRRTHLLSHIRGPGGPGGRAGPSSDARRHGHGGTATTRRVVAPTAKCRFLAHGLLSVFLPHRLLPVFSRPHVRVGAKKPRRSAPFTGRLPLTWLLLITKHLQTTYNPPHVHHRAHVRPAGRPTPPPSPHSAPQLFSTGASAVPAPPPSYSAPTFGRTRTRLSAPPKRTKNPPRVRLRTLPPRQWFPRSVVAAAVRLGGAVRGGAGGQVGRWVGRKGGQVGR